MNIEHCLLQALHTMENLELTKSIIGLRKRADKAIKSRESITMLVMLQEINQAIE